MLKKVTTIVYIMFVFSSLIFSTGFLKGNDLVGLMREYEKSKRGEQGANKVSEGIYFGYVMGIVDADNGKSISLNASVTAQQLLAIVCKYLNESPEKWDKPAQDIVIEALKKAFPKKE